MSRICAATFEIAAQLCCKIQKLPRDPNLLPHVTSKSEPEIFFFAHVKRIFMSILVYLDLILEFICYFLSILDCLCSLLTFFVFSELDPELERILVESEYL